MNEHKCEECGEPAALKCSACKLVAYCGKEHQKKHWKQHKSLCRPFEVGYRFIVLTRQKLQLNNERKKSLFTKMFTYQSNKTNKIRIILGKSENVVEEKIGANAYRQI